MGDAARDRLSDRGSIPLRSIEKAQCLLGFFVFARHGRTLTGASPEYAQIVGSV